MKIILHAKAIFANTPKLPYVTNIKIITAIIPITLANFPEAIESLPKPGPTERSSKIIIGTGNAPDLKTNAKSLVSWREKLPVICPLEKIWDWITGALTTLPSKTMAKALPIFFPVTLPNFFPPIAESWKDTEGLLFLSKLELASFDYIIQSIEGIYPLIEIHNLIFYGNEPYGAELLANNAVHAGVVLGPETKLPTDKIETDLKLIYDNEIIDTWNNKMWPVDMLSELNWLVKEQAKNNNYLKKGDLILTGAYGFPVPINDKKLIEVTSSTFGDVKATFY